MGRIHVRPQDRRFTYSTAGAVGMHNVRGVQWSDFRAGSHAPGDEMEMFVCVARFEAGTVDPLHRFDQPYLLSVLSGRMIMGGADSDEGVELPTGSIVYLDANEDFWFKAPDDEAVEFMVAHPRAAHYSATRASS